MNSPQIKSKQEPTKDVYVFWSLVIATSAAAILLYGTYLQIPRDQWAQLHNDRNAYLLYSLRFSVDLRYADLVGFLADLHRLKTQPPLFTLVAAPVLAVGGFHYQSAALVSVAGWVGSVLLTFLLVRRLSPAYKNATGLLAALCVMNSPPFQFYATDIMLESLGACLTLVVLLLYLRARDIGTLRAMALLGCGLTALFFLKYNYWLLVVIALALWEVRPLLLQTAPDRRQQSLSRSVPQWLLRELRSPTTFVLAGLLVMAGILALLGQRQLFWNGHRVMKNAPLDLIYAFYAVLWIKVALTYWQNRDGMRRYFNDRTWQLVQFHVVPVSLWLLWPAKLQHFLSYVGITHYGERADASWWSLDGLSFYPAAIVNEYHQNPWIGTAVIALALYAYLRTFRFGPEARLILLFVAASAILTMIHPNVKSRFLHSWLPSLWIVAAIGFSSLLLTLEHRWSLHRANSFVIRMGLILALSIYTTSLMWTAQSSAHAAHAKPTALDLSDYYLPLIGCYSQVAIFSTVPLDDFAGWTYLERYPAQRRNLAIVMKKLTDREGINSNKFEAWIRQTSTQAVVFIDIPPGSTFHWPHDEHFQQFRTLIKTQNVFQEVEHRTFPQYGSTVSILVRAENMSSRLSCR